MQDTENNDSQITNEQLRESRFFLSFLKIKKCFQIKVILRVYGKLHP